VTSIGCVMWGVCTAGFSVCRSLNEGYLFWAINGIGLSLVIPTGQSLIADYYQVGSMICKLLCTKKELYSNFGLYAPDPLGQHIFCKWINLERLQCLCVQTRQTKIGDNNCQASKHILYVVDHGSLYWHYAKCWQWLHRQVLIPFSPPWVSYNASWPDCEVAFNSLVVCWV